MSIYNWVIETSFTFFYTMSSDKMEEGNKLFKWIFEWIKSHTTFRLRVPLKFLWQREYLCSSFLETDYVQFHIFLFWNLLSHFHIEISRLTASLYYWRNGQPASMTAWQIVSIRHLSLIGSGFESRVSKKRFCLEIETTISL